MLHTAARELPSYTHEHRVLSGSVYDLETYEIVDSQRVVRLVLDDGTFSNKVECIFSTNQEQKCGRANMKSHKFIDYT